MHIENIDQIIGIHKKLRTYLKDIMGTCNVEQKDIAAAFLTSGYLEITPKVERTQDMVSLWQDLQKNLIIKDNADYISVILTYGRIRDLSAQYFLTGTTILEIKDAIRKYIDAKV